MDLQLKGKNAFVSGSTKGIGNAIAKQLLQEGANVIINGRDMLKVNEAVAKLSEEIPGANISGIAADFSKVEEVEQLLKQLPPVDILINNLGIFWHKPFLEITDEEWLSIFELNTLSGIRLSRALLPKMLEQNWGRIIFISSEAAIHIPEEMIHYGTSKTAQLAVSRGLAEMTKNTNVTVNAILPGPTRSEGAEELINNVAASLGVSPEQAESDYFKAVRPNSLLQRLAKVSEVASLVTFVASPISSAINGASLRVEGGLLKSIY